jgi:hypothetical protein
MSKNAITHHTKQCLENPEIIQGYAVGIVGTKRTAYMTFKGISTTYNESEAFVGSKESAITKMSCLYDQNTGLYKYAQLVPVRGDMKNIKGGMLPTINGY